MKIKRAFIIFLLFTECFTAQNINFNKLPIEEKFPIRVRGTEKDDIYFSYPGMICYDRYQDKVLIADIKDYKIKIFNGELDYIEEFGNYGQGPGEFVVLQGVDLDREGNMLISEWTRIQIINKDKKPINILNISLNRNYAKFDKRGFIYINNAKDGFLFSVFSKNGDLVKKFGDIYNPEYENFKSEENEVYFDFDEEDNLYCAFTNYPILRKYNKDYNLVYEKKLNMVPEVKKRLNLWNKKYKKSKDRYSFVSKTLINDLCCDENFID